MAAKTPPTAKLPTFWQRNLAQEVAVLALLLLLFAVSSAAAMMQLRQRYIAIAAAEAEKVELRLSELLQKARQQLRLFAELGQGEGRRSMAELMGDFSDLYQLNRDLQVTEVIRQRPTSQVFPQFSLSRGPLATYLRQPAGAGDFSPLLRGVEDGRPSIYIAVPQGDGLLLGRVDLESLERFLQQFSSTAGTPVLLVARDGSVLLSSHDTLRIPTFESDPGLNEQVIRPAMRIGTQTWIPIITPARSVGAAIVTLLPSQPLAEEQQQILLLLLVACTGSSVLILLKNLRMRRLLIQPISTLAQRMHALKGAATPLPPPASAPAFAELAALESAFEAMALAIREREEGLQRRANRDELTGLLNRRGLLERLETLLSAARRRHDDELGLLFLDLDLFKQINDNLGHAAGDTVLRTVAERVSDRLRAGDLAGRMGGDEFVVVLGGLTDLAAAIAVAGTILEAIEQPIRGGDFEITISASLGVTLARSQETLDDVMARADTAMYRAKQSGSRIVPIP